MQLKAQHKRISPREWCRMEQIDRDWIAARLTHKRGEKTRLAAALGVPKEMISRILSGERKVQASEIPAIMSFFQADQHEVTSLARDIESLDADLQVLARDFVALLKARQQKP